MTWVARTPQRLVRTGDSGAAVGGPETATDAGNRLGEERQTTRSPVPS
jgi:hypothetical protein